jgi:hypothetical protein
MKRKKKRARRRGSITAGELLAELEADPVWVAERAEQDRELAAAEAAFAKLQRPLLADLRKQGIRVDSIEDQAFIDLDLSQGAIGVLVDHLERASSPWNLRAAIARSLSRDRAATAQRALYRSIKRADFPFDSDASQALFSAFGRAADNSMADEIIELLRAQRFGPHRCLLALDGARTLPKARCSVMRKRRSAVAASELRRPPTSLRSRSPRCAVSRPAKSRLESLSQRHCSRRKTSLLSVDCVYTLATNGLSFA